MIRKNRQRRASTAQDAASCQGPTELMLIRQEERENDGCVNKGGCIDMRIWRKAFAMTVALVVLGVNIPFTVAEEGTMTEDLLVDTIQMEQLPEETVESMEEILPIVEENLEEKANSTEEETTDTVDVPAVEEIPVVEETTETEEAPEVEENIIETEEVPEVEEVPDEEMIEDEMATPEVEEAPEVEEETTETEEAPEVEEEITETEEAPEVEEETTETEEAPEVEEEITETEEAPEVEEEITDTEEAPEVEEETTETEEAPEVEEEITETEEAPEVEEETTEAEEAPEEVEEETTETEEAPEVEEETTEIEEAPEVEEETTETEEIPEVEELPDEEMIEDEMVTPEVEEAPQAPVVTIAAGEAIRDRADGLGLIVGTITESTEIKVLEVEGDWVKVEVDGQIGYVYIDAVEGIEKPETDTKSQMKVTIFSSRSASMAPGATVYLTSKLEGFEGYEIVYQWECDRGNGFEAIEGANGATYAFDATIQTLSYDWRLSVYYR